MIDPLCFYSLLWFHPPSLPNIPLFRYFLVRNVGPIIAKQMLTQVSFLQPSIDLVYSHHERWDGKGYPEGLMGDQIPLSARIFAIVDQWDALRSDRPYRKAWPVEKVLVYIRDNVGVVYDPDIVEVFLTLVDGKHGK